MPPRPTPDALWGPPFSKYIDDFEQRTPGSPALAMNLEEVYPANRTGFTPLTEIARSFVTFENIHRRGYEPAGKALIVPLAALRKYYETNKKIFARLYGFLCIKLIITILQDSLLMTAWGGSLHLPKMGFSPDDDPTEIFDTMTAKAMEEINAGMQGQTSIAKILGMPLRTDRKALPICGGLSEQDARFLTDVLWQDRKSFLFMCNRGLLDGSTTLFFIINSLMTLASDLQIQQWYTRLNDVLLRYYISDPVLETITLRHICLGVENNLTSKVATRSAVDSQDAREIAESYVQFFSPPLTVETHARHLFDISTLLFEFVYDNLVPKDMQDLIPDIMKGALARLWLEYDAEKDGIMAPKRQGFSRRYMGDMCHYIRLMKEKMIGDEGLSIYSRMLLDIDIVNLLGRTLLLLIREKQYPNEWESLLDGIGDLNKGLRDPVSFAQMAFADSHEDWIKVFRHFRIMLGAVQPRHLSQELILDATHAWLEIGLSMRFARPASWAPGPPCTNPYCIEPVHSDSSIGAHLVCQQCQVAHYCNRTCQNAHWELKSPLSHVNECVLPKDV